MILISEILPSLACRGTAIHHGGGNLIAQVVRQSERPHSGACFFQCLITE